jgi:hypothetical protein
MTLRENVRAIMKYENYTRMPVIHFGFWPELLQQWHEEGHISKEEVFDWSWTPGNEENKHKLEKRLGFDFNWFNIIGYPDLFPEFEHEVLETESDGCVISRAANGTVVRRKPNTVSLPQEVDHLLKDRKSWEEHYLPRIKYHENRIDFDDIEKKLAMNDLRDCPIGLFAGSLIGFIRNYFGVVNLSYVSIDDPELLKEIIDTIGNLAYKSVEQILAKSYELDYIHFWEDISCKSGPLVNPKIMVDIVGPHYKKITSLCKEHGYDYITLDSDGCIDELVGIWVENGVNTMFPIEVGTWQADIRPWREKYGKELRGIGGMNKNVLTMDYAAVDKEIERLKPLVDLGGFIPCPDHLIALGSKFENVQYYCEKIRNL